MSSHGPVKVVIVDDHPVVRDGLNAILSTQPDFKVVGEAGSGIEALQIIPELRPQVVVMDLMLPDLPGWDVIRRMASAHSDMGFVVLTSAAGDEDIYRAIEAGARGYLFKDMARKELIQAIRAVHDGRRYVPAEVGSRVVENLPRPGLSAREIEVLQCVAAGLRNKEIGNRLGIAENTVNAHLKNILEKLNVSDRTLAVTTALRRGIIRL
ncbi:MAG: DNA-binding response regulator [Proteobacteria bacterium]|nr:MAG: DNA-binding response regulator [Pseudomonadota bacterium]